MLAGLGALAITLTVITAVPANAGGLHAADASKGAIRIEGSGQPVPLIQKHFSPSSDMSLTDPQDQTDQLDRQAAKTTIESDGYRRVVILKETRDGGWRAKAYRGTTEVVLTVDSAGRVSLE